MSDYDKRYNVSAGMVSYYTDDPAQALKQYNRYPDDPNRWIVEGYADYEDRKGGTLITRRTTGRVLPSTLEFLVQREIVQNLLCQESGNK